MVLESRLQGTDECKRVENQAVGVSSPLKKKKTGRYIEGVCGAEVGEIWACLYPSEKEPVRKE